MWETKFDTLLNQVYYVGDDGTITFDLPCEVQSSRGLKTKSNIFYRISSKLSLMRSKSNTCENLFRRSSKPSLKPTPSSESSQTAVESDGAELAKTTSGSYFADSLGWNITTALHSRMGYYDQDDMSTVSSVDSIESFYSELPNDIHDDNSIYDKELERHELRQQFIRELY